MSAGIWAVLGGLPDTFVCLRHRNDPMPDLFLRLL